MALPAALRPLVIAAFGLAANLIFGNGAHAVTHGLPIFDDRTHVLQYLGHAGFDAGQGGLRFPKQNTNAAPFYQKVRPDLGFGLLDRQALFTSDKNNFAPSFGFAYSPDTAGGPLGWVLGTHRGVIRGGYQIGYDSFFNNIASNAQTSSPNIISTLTTSTVSTASPRGIANFSSAVPTTPRGLLCLRQTTTSARRKNGLKP